MALRTVRDIDVKGKRVLVRVDYNVPIKDGAVGDTLRIEASFETINYLLEQGCSLVLMSHLGRPDGKPDPKYSLGPVATKAGELLGREVKFAPYCIGEEAESAVRDLKPGEIILLENLRFHPEEEANDPAFARQLASLGEAYVDDAFAAIHRAHASTVGVTEHLPSATGLLVEKEIKFIRGALEAPNRPMAAIIGGAKVSTKLEVIEFLAPKVDVLVLGGAMANTFFLAQGKSVGKSLAEPDMIDAANKVLEICAKEDTQVLLPDEVVVSRSLEAAENVRTVGLDGVEEDDFIVDASPSLARRLETALSEFLDFDGKATIIWNGPVGVTEVPEFAAGSRALAEVAMGTKGTSVIGGGDTAAFVDEAGLHDRFTWVSTGGGASLELMSGRTLPGLEVLEESGK